MEARMCFEFLHRLADFIPSGSYRIRMINMNFMLSI